LRINNQVLTCLDRSDDYTTGQRRDVEARRGSEGTNIYLLTK